VATWNDVSGTGNNASDLTINPANGAAYIWDERNQLSTASSPDYSFFYDAFGRRESFDDFGIVTSYIGACRRDTLLAVQTNSTTTPASSQFHL